MLFAGSVKLIRPFDQLEYGSGEVLMDALRQAGLFPVLATVEVAAGIALLGASFVPLALVVLAPIVTCIVCFHVFLESTTRGLLVSVFLVVAMATIAWQHRSAYRALFRRTTR
jgi:hypothetical protein